jgi:hypothetical protein
MGLPPKPVVAALALVLGGTVGLVIGVGLMRLVRAAPVIVSDAHLLKRGAAINAHLRRSNRATPFWSAIRMWSRCSCRVCAGCPR